MFYAQTPDTSASKMSIVSKSFENSTGDAVVDYCSKLTSKQHPLQTELQNKTLAHAERHQMLGAPEVLTLGSNFIELIGAKNILDIGTYTGASALAWALAAGEGANVYTFDITHDNYRQFGIPVISQDTNIFKRIHSIEGPAIESLDKLIAEGKAGTFDFAFIDADKPNYTAYYERSLTLLRKGGVIAVDNALWDGLVAKPIDPKDESTKAIDEANKAIFADDRTNSALINVGDGLHLAFKK